MNKVLSILVALILTISGACGAKEHDEDAFLSIISVSGMSATQVKVTDVLGTPTRIEESKKRVWWYYSKGATTMVISWNKKTMMPDKFSFTSDREASNAFSRSLSRQLQSGKTNLAQAIHILGTPKDMTIWASKQEVYYAFQDKMLRLFFRDRKLVDYCLY